MTLIFHDIIYGPVRSRRFGYSLGINLLPTNYKVCTFNCIYCECGWNPEVQKKQFTPIIEIINQLEEALISINKSNSPLDAITFAGNGEPTLHPNFTEIAQKVSQLRDIHAANKKIVLLTNGTTIEKTSIQKALEFIDFPVFKIDSAKEETIKKINKPNYTYSFDKYIQILQKLNKPIAIQTMLLKGFLNNEPIDNTTDKEIEQLIEIYKLLKPMFVMLYSIDRQPPLSTLQKIEKQQIENISNRIKRAGIDVKWV